MVDWLANLFFESSSFISGFGSAKIYFFCSSFAGIPEQSSSFTCGGGSIIGLRP